MFRKKLVSFILSASCILPTAVGLSACSKSQNTDEIKIVTTIFPQYDWAKNIVGDVENVSLTMLVNNGVDLHSYQPSVKDIATLSTCDLFIYVGGESDAWVEDALKNATNKNMKVINLLEVLGEDAKEEEIIEGMEGEEEEGEEGEEEEGPEYDEHVWLSIKNAIELTGVLCEKIQALDPSNEAIYKKNADEYIRQLADLDAEYEKAVAASGKKVILFGDRYPFRYMSDDYGLRYYAAFVGCSAESEASFETIAFLSRKVDELGLPAVLTIEKSNKKIAETVVANTKGKNQSILEIDSLQSVTEKEIAGGRNYLSAMKNNFEVLKKALK